MTEAFGFSYIKSTNIVGKSELSWKEGLSPLEIRTGSTTIHQIAIYYLSELFEIFAFSSEPLELERTYCLRTK